MKEQVYKYGTRTEQADKRFRIYRPKLINYMSTGLLATIETYNLQAFPCARASKLNEHICILPEPGRSSKSTHTGVEIDTCAFQMGCQLSSAAMGMSLGLCGLFFLHSFSGMKRTCWTTGSWRCCLCLEVVSSIPTGSTMIYRFLSEFKCVFPVSEHQN